MSKMFEKDKDSRSENNDDLNKDVNEGIEDNYVIEDNDDSCCDNEKLKMEIQKKDALINDYIAMVKRNQADFDNYRKRIEKDRVRMSLREVEMLVCKLLPVIDNLERALVSSKESRDFDALVKGVEMTEKTLKDILEKEGLKCIECINEEFDPNYHEALMNVKSDEHDDDMVCDVLEKGYVFKDKVIRPAKVKVVCNKD